MKKMKFLYLTLFILLTPLYVYSQDEKLCDLEIRITGLRNAKGKVNVNIFNKEEGFPDDPLRSFGWKTVKIVPDTVVIMFEDLPYGNYAVSVLHDENENGKIEKSFWGIPKEGFAFSCNYTPKYRSPVFSEAMLKLDKPRMTEKLKMLYY
jgi:uncharacterized protein (DUF2141 family)